MRCNNHDIIALWSMHNPHNAGTIFCDSLTGSRPVGVAWIGLDPIRRADRRLDPVDSDVAYAGRFPHVLGEADHPTLAVMLGDLRVDVVHADRDMSEHGPLPPTWLWVGTTRLWQISEISQH